MGNRAGLNNVCLSKDEDGQWRQRAYISLKRGGGSNLNRQHNVSSSSLHSSASSFKDAVLSDLATVHRSNDCGSTGSRRRWEIHNKCSGDQSPGKDTELIIRFFVGDVS